MVTFSDFKNVLVTEYRSPCLLRYFSPDLEREGVSPLPAGSSCSADGQLKLLISFPTNAVLDAFGTYGFRGLVEDPSVPRN